MDGTKDLSFKIQHNLFDHLILLLLTFFSRHTGLDWPGMDHFPAK